MVKTGIFTIPRCRSSEPSTVGGGEFASHLVSLNFTPILFRELMQVDETAAYFSCQIFGGEIPPPSSLAGSEVLDRWWHPFRWMVAMYLQGWPGNPVKETANFVDVLKSIQAVVSNIFYFHPYLGK